MNQRETRVEARTELFRFFQVAKVFQEKTGKSANMPSCVVDNVWHNLLKEPASYDTFTQDAVGSEVTHLENKGEGTIEWVEFYHQQFGKLPRIWFVSPSGVFNQSAYDEYIQTGVMKMAWDCVPGIARELFC